MSQQKFLECASKMPAFRHSNDGDFSYAKSEVVKWLIGQEDTLRFVFETARGNGVIIYDETNEKWSGIPRPDRTDGAPTFEEIAGVFRPGEWLSSIEILGRVVSRYNKSLGMWAWNKRLMTLVADGALERSSKSRLYHLPIPPEG